MSPNRPYRYGLVLQPHSSLFIGGYAQAWGDSDGDTAWDDMGLVIPGSALKGALREAASRIVEGCGRGEDVLDSLFGTETKEGLIHIAPMRLSGPIDPSEALGEAPSDSAVLWEPVGRQHVSIDRARRQAVPQKLFQHRVTPAVEGLRFKGELRSPVRLEGEQLGLLCAAVRLTDQIGGGRGRGLGFIRLELADEGPVEQSDPPVFDPEAREIVFELEALEPLALGVIKDGSNYVAGKDYLEGSVLRGAIAAALLASMPDEEGKLAAEKVFGGESPARFGDARAGGVLALPAPLTLREPKAGGELTDLAVQLCSWELGARLGERAPNLGSVGGTVYPCGEEWRKLRLRRRTITRTARNTALGRGDDGRLFSIEILDDTLAAETDRPFKSRGSAGRRLRFYAPVNGTPRQLQRIAQALAWGIAVGGVRTRGFGRMRLAAVHSTQTPPLGTRHRRWVESLKETGVEDAESTAAMLALGPLAVSQQRLIQSLQKRGFSLMAGEARRDSQGGWNSSAGLQRSLLRHFVPGSIFILRYGGPGDIEEALCGLEESGIGPGRADGWGRLSICHPIHTECRPEPQSKESPS